MLAGLLRLAGYAADPLLDRDEIHAIVGEPARVAAVPDTGTPVTIVSWNIAQGKRYEQILRTLAEIDADIYLLQEVDMAVGRTDHREIARDLANDLGGLNWVFAGEFQEIGEARRRVPAVTGQAILSRFPIDDAFVLSFENQARWRWRLDPLQPRRGARIALRAESGGVLLYNAHIESAKDDKFRHKQIDEMLDDHRNLGLTGFPVVLAGDFNTVKAPKDSVIVQCLVEQGFADALGTMVAPRKTSERHDDPLDWIFVRHATAEQGRVVAVRDKPSDHYPLAATLSFASPGLVSSR
jgi:endonuclease/exonuclease/phosphatase family metal-dependent hydrolase